MKKKLLILVTLIMISLLCLTNVKADMGGPDEIPYEAVVSNPSGVEFTSDTCYIDDMNSGLACHENKVSMTIPYNTKVTVEYGYHYDGVFKGRIEYTVEKAGKTYVYIGEVDLSKFTLIEDFDLKNADHLKKPGEAIVVARQGVNMYPVPAETFNKILTIPEGTVLTYEYAASQYPDAVGGYAWIYVEYNGKKGWVPSAFSNLALAEKVDTKILTINDTPIYANVDYDNPSEIGIIPRGTKLVSNCFTGSRYKVKYNGIEGWVFFVATETNTEIKVLNSDKTIFYKYIKPYEDENSEKYNIKIPEGTVLNSTYSYGYRQTYYYVEYNGNSGWLYYDPYLDNEGDNYLDVKYIDTPAEPVVDPKPQGKPNREKKFMDEFTPSQIIAICIGAAIVIALTALITIKLVNKKKKNSTVVETPVHEENVENSSAEKNLDEKIEEEEFSTEVDTSELDEQLNRDNKEKTE